MEFQRQLGQGGIASRIRGVYLWAGSATVALQQAKFPDRPVDLEQHLHAHSAQAARRLAERGVNVVFLSMNWGFPPEREQAHWQEFAEAVRAYREAGIATLGYVQSSNCLAEGSYAENDWYALDSAGRRISYFRNRLMTCWTSEAWNREVVAHAHRAIDAGADGVYFDNLWMGATPWTLGGRPGGFAGCACDRCARAFREHAEHDPPRRLGPNGVASRFLDWRADRVASCFADWASAVRSRNPYAVVLANNCDVVLRDTRSLFGLDPQLLAPHQDALLIENVAVPRFNAARRTLVTNALTLKAMRALVPDRQLLAVTYQHGIGLDGPPNPRRLRQTLAETVALGAACVLKGSEYLDDRGRFSVITAPAFQASLAAAGSIFSWLDANQHLYDDAAPDPAVAVLLDEPGMRNDWSRTAPPTFAVALALQYLGIPYSFTTPASATALRVPLVLPPQSQISAQRGWIVADELDVPGQLVEVLESERFRTVADPILSNLARGYFGYAPLRRMIDATGLTRWFLQSPFFRLPRRSQLLAQRLPKTVFSVMANLPVLAERYRRADGTQLLHLVNYAHQRQRVTLPGHDLRLHTPDASALIGHETIELDVYAVMEITERA